MLEQIKRIMEEHIGKRNAITSAEIADMLGIDEDDTHAITRDLLLQAAEAYNLPLAASNRGYYLIDNETEYEEYMRRVLSRAFSTKVVLLFLLTKNKTFDRVNQLFN